MNFQRYLVAHEHPDVWWLSFPSDADQNFEQAEAVYHSALDLIKSLHTELPLVDKCDFAKHAAASNGQGHMDVRFTKEEGVPAYRTPYDGRCAVGAWFLSRDRMVAVVPDGALAVYEPLERVAKFPGLKMPRVIFATLMLHEFWHAYRDEVFAAGDPLDASDEEEIWVGKHVFPAFDQWSSGGTAQVFAQIDERTKNVVYPSEALAAIVPEDIDNWLSALKIPTDGPSPVSRTVLVVALWSMYYSYALNWCEKHQEVSGCFDKVLYLNVSQFRPK